MDNRDAAIIDGREFDLASLPEDLRTFYAQFLAYGHVVPSIVTEEYHRSAAEGRLRVRYVARRDFYLSAETSRGSHSIELGIGVPCLLHFIFNNALRLSHVFPQVGNAAQEKPYREADDGRFVPFELPEQMTTVEALQMLPGVSRPADVEQAIFASALTELACVYCVFHEVGHLIGGHAGYAARRVWGGSVKEFGGRTFTFCPRRLLDQVMEREADVIAMTMIMGFVLNDPSTRQHYGECFHLLQDEERYPYEILGFLLFAAKLLFLYLAQIPDRLNVRSVHPHPLVRATYVHNALRLAAIDDLGMDEAELDTVLDGSTDLADRVWVDLGMRVPAIEGSATGPELAQLVEREIVRLEEAHRRLQPKYARWSFIPESIWREHEYESQ